MKKIILYLIGFVALFGIAFVVYQHNLDDTTVLVSNSNDEELSSESKSSDDIVVEPTESHSETSIESTDASLTVEKSSLTWNGPVTAYLNSEGESIALSDNAGKPTILNIWATWCPPCRNEMPLFEEAYQTYGSDLNIVMINALESRPTETKEVALAFADEINLSMPIYFDTDLQNQLVFGATTLPLTALLDENGTVIEIVRGQVSPAKLQQLIDSAL